MEHAADNANTIANQPNHANHDDIVSATTHNEEEEVRGGYHPPSSVRHMGYFDAEAILQFADNYCSFTEGMYLHVASLDFTNGWVEIVG
jgi:hypothetical protein